MKTLTWTGLAAAGLTLAVLGAAAASAAADPTTAQQPATTTITVTADGPSVPTGSLAATLAYNREEEKLAHDVYLALAAKYPETSIFTRIASSEERHFSAVGTLLDRYDVIDPAAGKAAGSFTDPQLQALYTSLVAQGSASLDAAYQVGLAIEKLDISDLQTAMAADLPADVDRVLSRLLAGSQQHQAAFTAAAAGESTGVCDGTGTGGGAAAGGRMGAGRAGAGMAGGFGRAA